MRISVYNTKSKDPTLNFATARYNPYIRKHYENLKKSGKPGKLARTAANAGKVPFLILPEPSL
jgi:hypothetical protein